jgi:hypothetical protein
VGSRPPGTARADRQRGGAPGSGRRTDYRPTTGEVVPPALSRGADYRGIGASRQALGAAFPVIGPRRPRLSGPAINGSELQPRRRARPRRQPQPRPRPSLRPRRSGSGWFQLRAGRSLLSGRVAAGRAARGARRAGGCAFSCKETCPERWDTALFLKRTSQLASERDKKRKSVCPDRRVIPSEWVPHIDTGRTSTAMSAQSESAQRQTQCPERRSRRGRLRGNRPLAPGRRPRFPGNRGLEVSAQGGPSPAAGPRGAPAH